ncbi:hypothetical protein [Sulfurovum sp.]|jgi:hypothetical protein|uniref:hypothetical protein n=1 Tax=Sulfurovum sp. TaxID=1969726 RepID=UPI002A360DEC|nr:hypothetical protein [Sulfurovum sp.]MDD2450851.1 hypothetical protein [Sulfurovum sp.]MDY0402143.1 hypothetical protein [Sulfurovum sp.]
MKTFAPITIEYIRRFSILILLALFGWVYFYSPPDIYEIQVKNYAQNYQKKVENGSIHSAETSLTDYITKEMEGVYSWSDRKKNIVEVEGEYRKFLNHLSSVYQGDSTDSDINQHRSPNAFWSGNSYFFRSGELPKNFLSETYLKHPDYLVSKSNDGEKNYFRLYKVEGGATLNKVPVSVGYPLRHYSYVLIFISLLIYLLIPKTKVPEGAAHYKRLNAVYLVDALSLLLWMAAWMLFFLPDDSIPLFVRYFFLLFFGIFALAIILPTNKYASNWYRFTEDAFEWSGTEGIERVLLDDIIAVEPYKRQLPRWIAPLIILFGRGQAGPTGLGMITATATPEIGMKIMTKSGTCIEVMANYLDSDTLFTKRFQVLRVKVGDKADV